MMKKIFLAFSLLNLGCAAAVLFAGYAFPADYIAMTAFVACGGVFLEWSHRS